MPEAKPEDMRDPIPISLKPLVPAIPIDNEELRELGEDLCIMGCEGLLAQPWDVQDDKVLREFRFEQGNRWIGTKRRDPDNWTPDTWARIYRFQSGVGERWPVRRKVQRGCRSKRGPPPLELSKPQRKESVRILDAHL